MYNQQKVDDFWTKLLKAIGEIQNDFSQLDLREKKIIMERVNKVLQMHGIAISMDTLLNFMGYYRY